VVKFLNWVRLVIFVFLKKGGWPQAQRGVMRANGDGDTPSLPFGSWGLAPARGDDGHDRSFITRDFNRGEGNENGTIPF
jgi:hypothetical protein